MTALALVEPEAIFAQIPTSIVVECLASYKAIRAELEQIAALFVGEKLGAVRDDQQPQGARL